MRIVTQAAAMQRLARAWKRAGRRVALVPTMGFLHEGHLSLVRQARRRAGPSGVIVLSLYVNPTQFAPTEDLSRYPRAARRDRDLCRRAGVDVLFCPTDAVMYPGRAEGACSTFVVEESLSRGMEGASRPTHFRGVTTVVAKLFNLVLPDVAVFGAKDWQQAAVVQRMATDLNFPVRIVVSPTIREPDGLAMSSRNHYLSPDERHQARALSRAIATARVAARRSDRGCPAARLRQSLRRAIEQHPAARVDYIEFFDPATLRPVRVVRRGTQVALAVYVGKTRLIDNGRL